MAAEIWAIGGGKGGTGKSFLSSSIGKILARKGKKVILVDADLGGANLHTFLNTKKPKRSLTDFFEKTIALKDIVTPTDIKNLKLVTGDIRSLSPGSVNYSKRLKLYRHMTQLDADYVIADLGAGSQLYTVDTFSLAEKMVVVILPEVTAIENLYQFLKKVIFRRISNVLSQYHFRDVARDAWRDRKAHNIETINDFVVFLKGVSDDIRDIIEDDLSKVQITLVLNQIKNDREIEMGFSIKSVIKKYFGLEAVYAGYIYQVESFWDAVRNMNGSAKDNPGSSLIRDIEFVADNIIKNEPLKFM